jgi:3-phenylpropionate/cinnamic acid dioxygenase small subunit
MSALSRQEIEEFLYHEANLLDEWRLNEWLELFTDDAIYWIPCNRNDIDPTRELSLVYDHRKDLEDRVFLQSSSKRWCQRPPSKTSRMLSNVQHYGSDGDTVTVSSRFVLYELRSGTQASFIGRYEHHLRQVNGGWKIALKKVELLNNNDMLPSIAFLL